MTRKHSTENVAHIEQVMHRLGIGRADLAACFRVSESALGKWLRDGAAPFWTLPACRGLLLDHEAKAPAPRLLLVEVAADREGMMAGLLSAVGARSAVVQLGRPDPDFDEVEG
jgi:hypothetical protein